MKTSTPTPHDAVFKTFLSHPQTARDFLELHLQPDVLKICDLNTLKLESGSFIEEDLRPYYSDVLYSLRTTKGDGYIYVLIEHQSKPDKLMAFRLMRYSVAAMQRHLDSGHDFLPLVVPVLFYQGGKSPYPYSLNWLDLFSEPELAARLYGGAFPLVDITTISDDEIMKHRTMAVLTYLQKHIRQRDMQELKDRLITLLLSEFITGQQLTALINYMLQAGETPNVKGFIHELARQMPQHKDELMTMAKRLEQIGREQGLKKGMAEGMAQGMVQGIEKGREQGVQLGEREASAKIARNMLAKGFEIAAVRELTGLSEQDLQQICH